MNKHEFLAGRKSAREHIEQKSSLDAIIFILSKASYFTTETEDDVVSYWAGYLAEIARYNNDQGE